MLLALITGALFLAGWHYLAGARAAKHSVDFNRDIRPILNQNCVGCHGGVKQAGGVSFIYRAEALGTGQSGRPTIIPGNPGASELISRVMSRDADLRMPLHAAPLPEAQIALLKQWIREGAKWEDYWAFVPPKRQPLPDVTQRNWVRGPIDRFILARLEKEGLRPSAEADRATLLRRVSLDITGLPPTADELEAFLADKAPDAYVKQVDRLLASPHYGERWAAMWLDLARYADSRGYERDRNRPMWPYRDWVIGAFNANMPYDRFVITQLAGDLLPNARLSDTVATAFHRLTPANDEGGTDDEEYRVAAVMDRVATTWSVLNGLTMNCVQCHSHPYDPIPNAAYYKSLAFFNQSRDADVQYDNYPWVRVPADAEDWAVTQELEQGRQRLLRAITDEGRRAASRASWRQAPIVAGSIEQRDAIVRGIAKLRKAQAAGTPPNNNPFTKAELDGYYKRAIKQQTELLAKANGVAPIPLVLARGDARTVGTVPTVSTVDLYSGPVSAGTIAVRVEVLPVDPRKAAHTPEPGFIADDVELWAVSANGARRRLDLTDVIFDTESDVEKALRPNAPWPRGFAADSKLFGPRWIVAILKIPLAGERVKVRIAHSRGMEETKPAVPGRVRLSMSTDVRLAQLAADAGWQGRKKELTDLLRRLQAIEGEQLPVMADLPAYAQRTTMLFERGDMLAKVGPALIPDVPDVFAPLPGNTPRNRLAMARWFFAPGQPLTARVAVNRYWEQLFGTGIVETLEDFGSAGQSPSHPELLDWLALHFQHDLRWNMKALLRELVTSATYRQAAVASPALIKKDPHNRLLAMGPRQRLTAEMVRDQALVASGLFNPAVGGPSVMPPQPEGVWMTGNDRDKWTDAVGPDRYRRAVYTFRKRSAIYPSFVSFDASLHDVSLPRRLPTNTPLQALVTLNDPVYDEAAAALGRQMARAAGPLPAQLNMGARSVISRDLTKAEAAILTKLHNDMTAKKKSAPAAYKAVASALINLDAAMTR